MSIDWADEMATGIILEVIEDNRLGVPRNLTLKVLAGKLRRLRLQGEGDGIKNTAAALGIKPMKFSVTETAARIRAVAKG
jgi:hypothetical protein